jgi:hypothetical protein
LVESHIGEGTGLEPATPHALFIPNSPRRAEPVSAPGLMLPTLNLLIPRGFGIPSARRCEFYLAVQQKLMAYDKRFHWRTFLSALVYLARAEFVRFCKESQNGLENTKDRRSAGRHGNQHVCVRCPQVSGQPTPHFDAGGRSTVTRSRPGNVIASESTFDVCGFRN